ncbi:uncharacterized protein PGRI_019040 [Penicillium griseofulvum]|uniref:Retrovirus-related Pol polyprotein from transposon TNT 1-94-like beta-barrel domain-containing protein n=1 Tax=Penicillium patulum TaxID=5078 RepID=A0A135LGD9_PENPA|nr:uncharacterized protein PGRI_019040 [Penicillium griseofulvum]KXG48034.1 hypothetical protein PGRI_019040 [Penicillium griseofulvum]
MATIGQYPNRAPPPCPDWVFSNTSDTHVAKDRCWFGTDYTPFSSYVTDMAGGSAEVIGMGAVNLTTMNSPNETDPSLRDSLHLKNVLHVPAMLCNIIGSPMMEDYNVILGTSSPDNSGQIMSEDGRTVAYFKPMDPGPKLYLVQISEPPSGYQFAFSPFHPNGLYLIHAFWSRVERQRFADLKAYGLTHVSGVDPLTESEKIWFTRNHMSQDRILVAYGLDNNRREHRQEARAIMRILKSHAEVDILDY